MYYLAGQALKLPNCDHAAQEDLTSAFSGILCLGFEVGIIDLEDVCCGGGLDVLWLHLLVEFIRRCFHPSLGMPRRLVRCLKRYHQACGTTAEKGKNQHYNYSRLTILVSSSR